jgi:hypothetical protein
MAVLQGLLEEPTWEDLLQAEPKLGILLDIVRDADRGTTASFCGVTAWHGIGGRQGFKMRLYWLAGFRAHNPALRTSRAYEVATEFLLASLPPCRGCFCTVPESANMPAEEAA